MTDFQKFKSISPIFFLAWLFSGYFYLRFYYSFFGVEIHDFFSLEDYLRASISEIFLVIVCTSFGYILWLLTIKEREKNGKKLVPSDKFMNIFIWIAIFIHLIILLYLKKYTKAPNPELITFIYCITTILIYTQIATNFQKTDLFRIIINNFPFQLIISILWIIPLLVIILYFNARFDADKILYGEDVRKYVFQLEDGERYESSVIGANSNYFFLYDSSQKKVTLIQLKYIKSLIII